MAKSTVLSPDEDGDTNSIEYVPAAEANVVRKRKTAVVEAALSAMVKDHGTVSAQIILEDAKSSEHPLHEYFEWDDSAAANKYRLRQAYEMIMATKFVCFLKEDRRKKIASIVTGSKPSAVPLRRFLPAFTQDGFRERVDVLADEEARKSLVERKLSVLKSWCRSVVDIDELSHVRNGVLALLD